MKRQVITANKDKYSVSAMYHFLEIPRSSYYYKAVEPASEMEVEENIIGIKSRYGVRKLNKLSLRKEYAYLTVAFAAS